MGGTRYLSDFGQTGGKKGASRWEAGDAPNDVLRVGARVEYSPHMRKSYRQGEKEA